MKKNAIILLLTLSSFNAFSTNIPQVLNHIQSSPASQEQKIKAEYLVNSISRIFTERWRKDANTFKSISDDISISLSCYMHASENSISSVGVELVDDIQSLMVNTPQKEQVYLEFIKQDMKVNHTRPESSICEALV